MKKDDIAISIVDKSAIEKMEEKKRKAERILKLAEENGLDQDPILMDEIKDIIAEHLKPDEDDLAEDDEDEE